MNANFTIVNNILDAIEELIMDRFFNRSELLNKRDITIMAIK